MCTFFSFFSHNVNRWCWTWFHVSVYFVPLKIYLILWRFNRNNVQKLTFLLIFDLSLSMFKIFVAAIVINWQKRQYLHVNLHRIRTAHLSSTFIVALRYQHGHKIEKMCKWRQKIHNLSNLFTRTPTPKGKKKMNDANFNKWIVTNIHSNIHQKLKNIESWEKNNIKYISAMLRAVLHKFLTSFNIYFFVFFSFIFYFFLFFSKKSELFSFT